MSDLVDQGNETADLLLEVALENAKRKNAIMRSFVTGTCMNCGACCRDRWCDTDCRDDWEKAQR